MFARPALLLALVLLVPVAAGCGSDSGSSEKGSTAARPASASSTTTASPTTTVSMFDAATRKLVEQQQRDGIEDKFIPQMEKEGHRIDKYTVGCQPDTERTFTCTIQIDATAKGGVCGTLIMETKGVIENDGWIDFTSQRPVDNQQHGSCS